MKRFIIANFLVFLFTNSFTQRYSSDSTKSQHIQEVIVIGTTKISSKENKPLGSIDEYLQKSAKVDMVNGVFTPGNRSSMGYQPKELWSRSTACGFLVPVPIKWIPLLLISKFLI